MYSLTHEGFAAVPRVRFDAFKDGKVVASFEALMTRENQNKAADLLGYMLREGENSKVDITDLGTEQVGPLNK